MKKMLFVFMILFGVFLMGCAKQEKIGITQHSQNTGNILTGIESLSEEEKNTLDLIGSSQVLDQKVEKIMPITISSENSGNLSIKNINKEEKVLNLTSEINADYEFEELISKFDKILPEMKVKLIDNDNRFENTYGSFFKVSNKLNTNDYVFYKYIPQKEWEETLPPVGFLIKFDKKNKKNFVMGITSINSEIYLFNSKYLIHKVGKYEGPGYDYIFYNISNNLNEDEEVMITSQFTCELYCGLFDISNDSIGLQFYPKIISEYDCDYGIDKIIQESSKERVGKLYDDDTYLGDFDPNTKFEITTDDMIKSIEQGGLWFHANGQAYKYDDNNIKLEKL